MAGEAETGLSEILNGSNEPGGDVVTVGESTQTLSMSDDDVGGASDTTTPAETETEPKGKVDETSATTAQAKKDGDQTAGKDQRTVPVKALIEERKKRQELERSVAELQGKLSVLSQQSQKHPTQEQQAPKKEEPDDDIWVDPKGYLKRELTAAQQQLQQQLQQSTGRLRVELSEQLVRSVHKDYDEVVTGQVVEEIKRDPALSAEFYRAPNPALFVYEYGKMQRDLREVGSIDEYKAKIRAQVEQEVREKLAKEKAQDAAARVSTSSAGARSAGTAPVNVGDIPLSQILGQ